MCFSTLVEHDFPMKVTHTLVVDCVRSIFLEAWRFLLIFSIVVDQNLGVTAHSYEMFNSFYVQCLSCNVNHNGNVYTNLITCGEGILIVWKMRFIQSWIQRKIRFELNRITVNRCRCSSNFSPLTRTIYCVFRVRFEPASFDETSSSIKTFFFFLRKNENILAFDICQNNRVTE